MFVNSRLSLEIMNKFKMFTISKYLFTRFWKRSEKGELRNCEQTQNSNKFRSVEKQIDHNSVNKPKKFCENKQI